MGLRRTSLRRFWDEFVGPEATTVNNVVAVGAGLLGALVAPVVAARVEGRGGRQMATKVDRLVAGALALDLWGGVYVNSTRACARWYERPGQTDADHLRFAVLHVHPAAVAWLDRGTGSRVPGPLWAGCHYGYLQVSTMLIRGNPRSRRALGVALTLGGLALDGLLGRSLAAPWFAFTYYPKLLLGHAGASLWSEQQLAAASSN